MTTTSKEQIKGRGVTGIKGLGLLVQNSVYGSTRFHATARKRKPSRIATRSRSLHKHGVVKSARHLSRFLEERFEGFQDEDLFPEVQNGITRGLKRIAKSGTPYRRDDDVKKVARRFVEIHIDEEGTREFQEAFYEDGEIIAVKRDDGTLHSLLDSFGGLPSRTLNEWESEILSMLFQNYRERLLVEEWANAHNIEIRDDGADRNYDQLLELFRRDEKVKKILDFFNFYGT